MNYIVVDLEWNQSPYGKAAEVKEIPFEIIEIGAVKLNDNREIVDSFQRLIHPQIYDEIHSITKEIIHMEITDLSKADPFDIVIKEFFEWCGKNYRFATWGNMDLIELQRNLAYYNLTGYIDHPVPYYDVQKLFALCYYKNKIPRTLEYAVDQMGIRKTEVFHRAYVDAKYTAEILSKLDLDVVKKNYSLDYFHNPQSREEEIHLYYDDYYKYITKEFATKEEVMANREISGIVCNQCKQRVAKKIKWFTTNSKTYYCLAYCKEHGYLKGKIRIKKAASQNVFAVKVVKQIGKEDAALLMERYAEFKKRKREKRKASIIKA